jgi:protein-disulfide isomerase/rhodanese-related sulfurtransferase
MRKPLSLALSLLGLFDALYLLWVYTSPSRPMVCLGSGCDAVRASPYAHLFGLPLPAFGVVNYAALALLILAEDLVSAGLGRAIQYALAGITGGGFLFSLYLFSLQAFVIHAFCAWCEVSALVVTAIFVLSLFELRHPLASTEPSAAITRVRTNFVVCVVALVVGVPAFILLSRHGALPAASDAPSQASERALAEHLLPKDSIQAVVGRAPLTIVEFGDFECPACGLSEDAARQIRAQYGDRIRFVFRQFPLTRIHPQAEKAAEASECAAEQGKFWESVEKLYARQADLSVDALKRYAAELGLNQSRFDQCLDSGETAERVKQDLADGHALGVNGTPTYFIGRKMIFRPLDFATFSMLVDQELTNLAPTTTGAARSSPSAPTRPSSPSPKPSSLATTKATAPEASAGSAGLFGSSPEASLTASPTSLGACSEAEANKKQPIMIGTAEFRRLLEATPKPLVVDVRPAKEYATGRIPGAINMPAENFAQEWSKLPQDKPIVLYESGQSSGDICAASRAAGRALLEQGFSSQNVKVYQDGLAGWEKADQPIQH